MSEGNRAAARHHDEAVAVEREGVVEPKGLKSNALGLVTSTGVGIASTAPAYSLAATLGFVVAVARFQTAIIVLLAFIPMFFSAWATKEMNRADPDCGTSFTWAARALGPRTGWFAGGWGTIAADFLAMASYAQIAGQYVFLLVGADSIGTDPTSIWVLLLGILWIVGLTYICYRGIEISAHMQMVLVIVEMVILLVLSVFAIVKVANGTAPPGHASPSWSWFNPGQITSFNNFMVAMLLMVFIYWGWDTTTSVNEETEEPSRIPGTAGVISTVLLLATYLIVVVSVLAFAGVGTHGVGLSNPEHADDVLSVLGSTIFGGSGVGSVLSHLLILMVLTSAAATTQTTILPNARTTLSMAFHKAIPKIFGRTHPRYLTPTFSTISFGAASIVYYAAINFIAGGSVIADAVTATTFFAALYLGITGAACAWHYRSVVYLGVQQTVSQVVVPALAALSLFALLGWSLKVYAVPSESEFEVTILGVQVGGVMLISVITVIVGLAWMAWCEFVTNRAYFRENTIGSGLSLTEDDRIVPTGSIGGDGGP
ncbi:MAG TPA: APC family permease [Solirubrobacteraceae bacterium]|nr:APC family permease [Solirubrobacteraceae bacterium]